MRRTAEILWAASLVSALFAFVSPAQAQDWDPDTHRSGAGADMWLWSLPDAEFLVTSPIGFVNVEAADDFFIDVWGPWTVMVDPEQAAIGNPSIQFRYAPKMGMTRWWVGGGLGAPLAAIEPDRAWESALYHAAASMGLYNVFLWVDEWFPLWATGGADIRVVDFMSVQVSGEPMLFIDIDQGPDPVEFGLQTRGGVEFRHPRAGVGGGAHLKVFWLPTGDVLFPGDEAQFSVQPFFAYTGDVFFLRFGLLIAIDEPLSVADPGGVFSQELVLGGQW